MDTLMSRLGTLGVAAALLVFSNALYMTLVAFGNITDFGTNQAFVQHVLSMDTTNFTTKPGEDLDPHTIWRAIESVPLQNAAYVGVIVWETLAAIVLLVASWRFVGWLRGRRTLASARSWATVGLSMIVVLFFLGFIVIGGEWFQMWTSTQWNGLDPAFRNSVLAILAILAVHAVREGERA